MVSERKFKKSVIRKSNHEKDYYFAYQRRLRAASKRYCRKCIAEPELYLELSEPSLYKPWPEYNYCSNLLRRWLKLWVGKPYDEMISEFSARFSKGSKSRYLASNLLIWMDFMKDENGLVAINPKYNYYSSESFKQRKAERLITQEEAEDIIQFMDGKLIKKIDGVLFWVKNRTGRIHLEYNIKRVWFEAFNKDIAFHSDFRWRHRIERRLDKDEVNYFRSINKAMAAELLKL